MIHGYTLGMIFTVKRFVIKESSFHRIYYLNLIWAINSIWFWMFILNVPLIKSYPLPLQSVLFKHSQFGSSKSLIRQSRNRTSSPLGHKVWDIVQNILQHINRLKFSFAQILSVLTKVTATYQNLRILLPQMPFL